MSVVINPEPLAPEMLAEIMKDLRDIGFGYAVVTGPQYSKRVTALLADRLMLTRQVAELTKFKDYVHGYLDDKGVPTDPGGPHTPAGCRIGDRLDSVFARITRLEKAMDEMRSESDEQRSAEESAEHHPAEEPQ